jgi:hypothetical protein
MEMKDAVEEEDKDESHILRIQNVEQMQYATSGMIERALLAPNEIFNSSSQLYHIMLAFLVCSWVASL